MKKFKLLKGYTALEKKNVIFALCLLIFPIMQFLIFYLYVNITAILLAFQDASGAFTLDNFRTLFQRFGEAGPNGLPMSFVRSMTTFAVRMTITFPISIFIAYVLFQKIPGEMVFRILFFLPGLLGIVVMTTLYRYLVDAGGPVITLLQALGVNFDRVVIRDGLLGNAQTAFPTILAFGIWWSLGSNIVVLTGALTRIPKEIFESAKLDGVGFLRMFVSISFPLIWPTISTLLIFNMAAIFIDDNGTFLLIGNSQLGTSTIGFYIFFLLYELSQISSSNYGFPCALGFFLTLITMPVVLTVRYIIEKHTDEITY